MRELFSPTIGLAAGVTIICWSLMHGMVFVYQINNGGGRRPQHD